MSDFIDEFTIHKFLTLLHSRAAVALSHVRRPGVLQLVSIAPDDRGMTISPFAIGDIDPMLEAAVTDARAGRNVYVEARTVRPGRPTERGRGKLESTIGCFALVIDRDADTGKAGYINGNDTTVIETSPGNSHEWLFLDRALDAGDAKPLGERIRKAIGADHDTGVVTQPYRVPGTPNFPDAKKASRGRVVVPTELVRVSDRLWTPSEIEAVFSTAETQAERAQPRRKVAGALKQNGPHPSTPAAVKRRLARKASADMDRSAQFQSAVNAAARAGVPPDQLEAEMRAHPEGCASKYLESGDRLRAEIDRSYAKAEQATPPPQQREAPQHPPRALADVHDVFKKWFGSEFDTDTVDAVMAAAAAECLAGDPLWLLVVSGPGNAKTETVQSLSGAGALITSTIASEGALLSALPPSANATGGLLRKLGDRGILVIKDVTSILSADRNTRAGVLAALREVYDGRWERNVGIGGGQSIGWTGRIVIVGAVTSAWDVAHSVVSVMGDRFVLIRSDSSVGRTRSGIQAIRNTGGETTMRREMAAVVGGVIGHINTNDYQLSDDEIKQLVKVADIVTMARTAVERDQRGEVINSHDPEMPTRFAKQLAQILRGGAAIGMTPDDAMRLAIRCARDSIPPLRREILLALAAQPRARAIDVCHAIIKPLRTVRRELEALHMLGLLRCDEEQSTVDENKTIWRYSLADNYDRKTLLAMPRLHPSQSGVAGGAEK